VLVLVEQVWVQALEASKLVEVEELEEQEEEASLPRLEA